MACQKMRSYYHGTLYILWHHHFGAQISTPHCTCIPHHYVYNTGTSSPQNTIHPQIDHMSMFSDPTAITGTIDMPMARSWCHRGTKELVLVVFLRG